MDYEKVKALSIEVSKALTDTFIRFGEQRDPLGWRQETFQAVMNGSVSAMTAIAGDLYNLEPQQKQELAEITIRQFITKLAELRGVSATIYIEHMTYKPDADEEDKG